MQRSPPFPCAYAFKAALHITFDVLDQMVRMSKSEVNKLVREFSTGSENEPMVVERALGHVVSSIDAGNVVVLSRAFYSAYSLLHYKPAQLARGVCLVRSIFVTPGRLIFRPAQCTEMRSPREQYQELPKRTGITSTVIVTKCSFLHSGNSR
ncbi:uncharacterized protein LOC125942764 [Dermacentor silvarum]|uniref:uncharacterized protein LOC125942764 n=1 Tax=Dermacentor silvarum TaxID=543639 RepID=UPI0021011F94|nr:uncharacterized protein LOC125942764 [Dermacentor silvarum]